MDAAAALSLLREVLPVPPFPGSRPQPIFRAAATGRAPDRPEANRLIAAMRAGSIGGTSWGARPTRPEAGYRLIRAGDRHASSLSASDMPWRAGDVLDPWWLFAQAQELVVGDDDAAALLAGIAGLPLRLQGLSALGWPEQLDPATAEGAELVASSLASLLARVDCHDPMTGRPVSPLELMEPFALWRDLIDRNRALSAAFGFASWKQVTAAPMLWGGQERGTPFRRATPGALARLTPGAQIAVWKARVSARQLERIEAAPLAVQEVEDGFIRSVGLGANCVPPLSIVVDGIGVHYDPSRPSGHEALLAAGNIAPALLDRARALRARIVASGVSKYGVGAGSMPRRGGDRPHLLVVGQVEDDRSVRYGCGAIRTNAALLAAVRAREPEAWIVYRPHPDSESGHRPGRIPPATLARLADEVAADASISALISTVDQIHVMTSLAGFEALMHGKSVTTWGAPFYAGWGLTADLSPGWSRRRCNRTLDELIAVTLFLYPRYVDPVSGLPCTVETLVDRIVANEVPADGWLVRARMWLGRGKRAMAAVWDRVA